MIRLIFSLCLKGLSCTAIAGELNKRGISTKLPSSKGWWVEIEGVLPAWSLVKLQQHQAII